MEPERVAIVTGSNKGIGRTIAQHLARRGHVVVLNYRSDHTSAAEALAEISSLSPQSQAFASDVSTPEGARALIEQVKGRFGRIDILVNNVGPFLVKPLVDTEVEEWRAILDGNLSSAFYCCKFTIPLMRAQKSGHIVNLGSLNAETARGAPTTTAYNVAKSGLVVLTKSVARSEARYGIRCNIINPGYIETYATSESDRRELPSLIPLGRLGSAEEVANAVDFILSDDAGYITGAVLNVHGGLWV